MNFRNCECVILYLTVFLYVCTVTKINAQVSFKVRPSGRAARTANEGSFHLSLQFQDGYHFCSAALVELDDGKNFVHHGITAAQCFQHKIHPVFAVAGSMDLINTSSTLQRRLVTKVHTHPGFDPKKRPIDNDIAVVRFESNFVAANGTAVYEPHNLTVDVSPINITDLHVQGWGKMFPGWTQENVLQVMGTEFINGTTCHNSKLTKTAWGPGDFNPTNMGCYYPPTLIGPGDCHADAGSIVTDRNRRVLGVVTFGHDCYYPDTPGIFTILYRFASWMSKVAMTP